MGSPSWLTVSALAACALAAGDARADPRPLRVDYEAHEGCPAGDAFLEEVLARTSQARAAVADEAALDVRVRIARRAPRSVGRLVLWKESGLRVREVESDDCRDVVSALALITALAVDPEASRSRAPDPLPPPPAPPPPPSSQPQPPPPAPDPWRMPLAAPSPPPPPPVRPPIPPAPATETRRWVLGAHLSAAFEVTPQPLLGGGLFVERAWGSARGVSARLALDLAATGPFDVGPGAVSFLRGAFRAEGCPFLRPVPWLAVGACLGVEAGFLRGEGLPRGAISRVEAATVPWAAIGVLPRVSVDVGDIVFLAAQGGPALPLVRRSFVFERPDYVIHDVPAATAAAGLSGGIRF